MNRSVYQSSLVQGHPTDRICRNAAEFDASKPPEIFSIDIQLALRQAAVGPHDAGRSELLVTSL